MCSSLSIEAISMHVLVLHRYLEDELALRYRDAAPSTLALLQVSSG